ncbi:MAG: ATP-dependent helicase, partial [Patescibacteria group bacterium]|nr:ATP-dependent helicase [Patescibacteria group bacterium]
MTKSKLLKNLNAEQIEAVTHKNGPLLIIAGAGTGKTTVITHRIAWLIEQKLARPEEILALTFTEKAAAEMEERVDVLVPYGFVDTWISTFHAFGDRLLRDWALEIGLPANFKILTEIEQAIFLKDNIYAFDLNYFRPVANPTSHIEALLKHFSRLKDELIAPEEYLHFVQNQKSKIKNQNKEEIIETEKTLELANAYQRYCELMLQNGNLDFGDQVFLTYKLLKKNPTILKKIRKKFKYILVDEFQDTNYAQNEIVKLLAGKNGNITVVGDDDQAIYRFRGASISNILDFKKHYSQTKQVVLNQNYRSTQEILNASYKLIQHNNPYRLEIANKINKKLLSPKHGANPELMFCENLSGEADLVTKKIVELKNSSQLKYKDFVILVRANSHAEPFIQSLNMQGIPHIFSGTSGLFNQPEIKNLISFLKCLVYHDDNLSFYQLATGDIYNVSHQTLTDYYTRAARANRAISEIFKIGSNDQDKEKYKIKEAIDDIGKYIKKKNEPAGEVLYEYLTEKQYLKNLTKNLNIENELKIYNIAKFFDKISQFNHCSQDQSVGAFLQHLEMLLEFGEEISVSNIDPDLDAVNILTVHAAKGLEWPAVFIANCVNDRFPSRNKHEQLPIPDKLIKEKLPEGDFHLQEERRLFYVAATRAKDYLFLTSAEDYGGKRVKKLSPF